MPRSGIVAGVAFAHLVATGCYDPELRDCTVRCTSPNDCTGGQVCRKDGWCAMPDVAACPKPDHGGGQSHADAARAVADAPVSPPCEQGCPGGTCEDGVCVIDCSSPHACADDVTCPPNLPCRVYCGDHACSKKVSCGMATTCEVLCLGDSACAAEIQCNESRCKVDCAGASSCKRRTKCGHACACDVTCGGLGACAEPAECPEASCGLGNGCNSLLPGCDRCA